MEKAWEFIKSIIHNHNINWVGTAFMIAITIIGIGIVLILSRFNTIKKNWVGFRKWVISYFCY